MDLSKFKSGASATPPSATEAVSSGYPTAGSAVDDIPATKAGPYWFYQLEQEIAAVLADASIVADKATLTQLRDAIRAIATSKAGASVQTTTSTGTQNDFAATAARRLALRANNATTLTLSGFAAGSDGDVIELISVGAGEVDITNQDAGSTAANRVITPTGATVKLTAAKGRARFVYDNTTQRWRMTSSDPGSTQIVQEGVSFPASQVSSSDANTLDDYEEGTFTPVIGGAGGQSGQSYAIQKGTYVKIGKVVVANIDVKFSTKGTITGALQISGLPFVAETGAPIVGSDVLWDGTATALVKLFTSIVAATSVGIIGAVTAAATITSALATGDVGNGTEFRVTMVYTTNT